MSTLQRVLIMGATPLFAVLLYLAYDDWLIYSCRHTDPKVLEQDAREWIVTHFTKSRHPNDETSLPDGTEPSDLINIEKTALVYGYHFYTPLSGGVAFEVLIGDRCNMDFGGRQKCPNHECSLLADDKFD